MNWLINSVYYYFPGSADEDSGVGGSPGSSSRAAALHNCSMCSKKFSRADILRKHLKTHVNSSCTVCGQIFNDKVALAKHQVEVGQLSTIKFCHPALSSRVNKVATIHDDPHQYFFGINYFKLPLRLEDPLLAFFIILKLSIFCSFSKTFSMTTLLTHTVAHSTKPSFMLQTNNQPPKKFLNLALSWAKVVKNGKILTFKVNFLCQKIYKSLQKKNFIEEYDFMAKLFVNEFFWKLQFLSHFIS